MNKITLLFTLACFTFFSSYGQLNISVVDPGGTWNGWIDVYNTSDGSFVGGTPYDESMLKYEFDGSTATVKPNYQIWVDFCGDPNWFDGNTCPNPTNPNKNISALSFNQLSRSVNPAFFNQDVIFSGNIDAFTIDAGYIVKAFITIFAGNLSVNSQYIVDITGTGTFTVTRPLADVVASDSEFTYGFAVFGLPADPANEAALGSVVFSASTAGVEDYQLIGFSTYPNPTQNSWTVKTKNKVMSSIHVFDILGKNVLSMKPNLDKATIDGSSLKAGIYFAQVKTAEGVSSIKLIKQ